MKLTFSTLEVIAALDRVLQERGLRATDTTELSVPGLPDHIDFEVVMTDVEMGAPVTVPQAKNPPGIRVKTPAGLPEDTPPELQRALNKGGRSSGPTPTLNRTGVKAARNLQDILEDPEDFASELSDRMPG